MCLFLKVLDLLLFLGKNLYPMTKLLIYLAIAIAIAAYIVALADGPDLLDIINRF
jgi:hypothetical protein